MAYSEAAPSPSQYHPEVLTGTDTGYIRNDPGYVSALLTKSFEAAGMFSPKMEATSQRLVDICSHFGNTLLRSSGLYGNVVDYEAGAYLYATDKERPNVKIKLSGYVSLDGQPGSPGQSASIEALPAPSIRIMLGEMPNLDHLLVKKSDAQDFKHLKSGLLVDAHHLAKYLPGFEPRHQEAGAKIDGYTANMPGFVVGQLCAAAVNYDYWHQSHASHSSSLQEQTGYAAILYIPQPYFGERNRAGDFFSFSYPESMFPHKLLRSHTAFEQLTAQSDRTEPQLSGIRLLTNALPLRYSSICQLIARENGAALPGQRYVTTHLFEKAVDHILGNEGTEEAVRTYRKLYKIANMDHPDTEMDRIGHIRLAFENGLLDKDPAIDKRLFEKLVYSRHRVAITMDVMQPEIDAAYESLVALGRSMRGTVYSDEDLALLRKELRYML